MKRSFKFILWACILLAPGVSRADFSVSSVTDYGEAAAGYVVGGFKALVGTYGVTALLTPPGFVTTTTAVGGGVALGLLANRSNAVTSSGDIGRNAVASWIDLADFHVKGKAVTAGASFNDIKTTVNNKPSTYPNLKNAMSFSGVYPVSENLQPGQVVNVSGTYLQITGISVNQPNNGPSGCNPAISYSPPYLGYNYGVRSDGSTCYGAPNYQGYIRYNVVTTSAPQPSPATPQQFQFTLKNTADLSLKDIYANEFDNFLKNESNVVHVYDSNDPASVSGGSTFSAPTAANNAQVSANNIAQNSASRSAAASSAAGAAWQNYSSSGGHSNGSGGDLALKKVWYDSQAAASQAAADAAKDASASYNAAVPGKYGDGSTYDFGARFTSFMNGMKSSSFFGLPGQIMGSIPSSSTSSYSLGMGRYGNFSVDLASYSSALLVLKVVLQIVVAVYCVKIVTLKGGSG